MCFSLPPLLSYNFQPIGSVRMHAIDLLVRVRSAARNQVVKREVRKGKLKREVMVIKTPTKI